MVLQGNQSNHVIVFMLFVFGWRGRPQNHHVRKKMSKELGQSKLFVGLQDMPNYFRALVV